MVDTKHFEQAAVELLRNIDPDGNRGQALGRPYMIELFGTPNSGKTTQKQMIRRFFKRQGWRVSAPTEGAEVIETPRIVPHYNLQTTGYALQIARQAFFDRNFHMFIFDRAIYDGIARWQFFVEQGICDGHYQETMERYFLLPENSTDCFDAHICLVASPEVAMSREPANALTGKVGGTVNPKTLDDLLKAHRDMWSRLRLDENPAMAWVDTSDLSIPEVSLRVLDAIFRAFERRVITQTK